jgi:hypothetical protein
MNGAAYMGEGRLGTVSVDVGPPGPGEVQVAVAYCGLCGTDLHIVHGDWMPGCARPSCSAMRRRAPWRRSARAWRAGTWATP